MLLAVSALQVGPARAETPLTVTAQTPVVTVTRRPPGRYLLDLPSLEFDFDITAHCSDARTPQSLSVSIADTRTSLSAAELEDGGQKKIVLKVPAQQLAPVSVNNFCVVDDAGTDQPLDGTEARGKPAGAVPGSGQMTVDAALSAQVSLLCGGEAPPKITYVTQPLAVTLSCTAPEGPAARNSEP